eukprot:533142-Rhodomonas_salina.1
MLKSGSRALSAGPDLGRIWARFRSNLGQIEVESGPDLGRIWVEFRLNHLHESSLRADLGEIAPVAARDLDAAALVYLRGLLFDLVRQQQPAQCQISAKSEPETRKKCRKPQIPGPNCGASCTARSKSGCKLRGARAGLELRAQDSV